MKLKPYAIYKDSGVEWIGEIPEDWDIVKGKIEFKVMGGYAFNSNEFVEEGICLIRIGEIQKGSISFENCKKLPKKYSILKKEFLVNKNDILIAMTGATIGKIGQVPNTDETLLLNQRVGLIVSKFSDYFKFVLSSDFIQSQIMLIAEGSAQENISSEQIENFKIPKIDDQLKKQIANFLDKKTLAIDKAIEKNKKLIELLEEKRTSLINHVVTKGLDPNAKMKHTKIKGMPKIPYHWKVSKIKHELYFLDHKRIPLSAEVRGTMEKKFDYYGASGVIDKVDDYIFDGEFILIGEDGANLLSRSSPLAFIANGKFWVNNHAHILDSINGSIYYFVYLLETIDYTPYIKGSAQPKLNADDLKNIFIIVPPVSEQKIIGQFIKINSLKINNIIEKIKFNLKLLEEYKKSLIYNVVTGKVSL